jgi:Protein of unknown function (DUF3039)
VTDLAPLVDLDAAPPEPEDHEPVAHIVRQADLTRAMFDGGTVIALCGRRFDPKLFNPDGLDTCEPCLKIAASGNYR